MKVTDVSIDLFNFLFSRFSDYGFDSPGFVIAKELYDLKPGLSDEEILSYFAFFYPTLFPEFGF